MNRTEKMPSWVYWGLWGIRKRSVGVFFLVLSVVLTLIIVPYAIVTKDYKLCVFAVAPVWYWYAIKWVDVNSSWENSNNA